MIPQPGAALFLVCAVTPLVPVAAVAESSCGGVPQKPCEINAVTVLRFHRGIRKPQGPAEKTTNWFRRRAELRGTVPGIYNLCFIIL
jgi:hypothetical protein